MKILSHQVLVILEEEAPAMKKNPGYSSPMGYPYYSLALRPRGDHFDDMC